MEVGIGLSCVTLVDVPSIQAWTLHCLGAADRVLQIGKTSACHIPSSTSFHVYKSAHFRRILNANCSPQRRSTLLPKTQVPMRWSTEICLEHLRDLESDLITLVLSCEMRPLLFNAGVGFQFKATSDFATCQASIHAASQAPQVRPAFRTVSLYFYLLP